VRGRCRTNLTKVSGNLPEILWRRKGKRGQTVRCDARNLRERLVRHGESVRWFMSDPDTSFTTSLRRAENQNGEAQTKISAASAHGFTLGPSVMGPRRQA